MPAQDFANQLMVRSPARRCRPNIAALLVHGVVDDSRTLPDLFVLRFRDPDHACSATGITIGTPIGLAVRVERADRADAAARPARSPRWRRSTTGRARSRWSAGSTGPTG